LLSYSECWNERTSWIPLSIWLAPLSGNNNRTHCEMHKLERQVRMILGAVHYVDSWKNHINQCTVSKLYNHTTWKLFNFNEITLILYYCFMLYSMNILKSPAPVPIHPWLTWCRNPCCLTYFHIGALLSKPI